LDEEIAFSMMATRKMPADWIKQQHQALKAVLTTSCDVSAIEPFLAAFQMNRTAFHLLSYKKLGLTLVVNS
jgi:hypothetical protein